MPNIWLSKENKLKFYLLINYAFQFLDIDYIYFIFIMENLLFSN